MILNEKPLAWCGEEIKTPPFSREARLEAGSLLGRLQQGENLGPPHSRPMPIIGKRCHELRIKDQDQAWRIIYRVDGDAIVIAAVFPKKSQETPKHIIETCQRRLQQYDEE